MKNRIFFLLLSVASVFGLAQNIPSALTVNERYDLRTGFPVEKIEVKTTYHESKGITEEKEILHLNTENRVVRSERFDSGGVMIRRKSSEYKFDTVVLSGTTVRRIPLIGNETEKTVYEYDSEYNLVKILKKNAVGTVIMTVSFENDEEGNPVKMIINNGELGFETAVYDYDENIYNWSVYSPAGELLSSQSMKFNKKKPSEGNSYNEYGDLTLSANYIYEYKYDKKGNWTRKIQYQRLGNKKQKTIEYSRKITYK